MVEPASAPHTPRVIVSMTTYPPRIGAVPEAMESLLHQTVAPDRIVLCIAEDDFPELPEETAALLAELQRKGIEVLWAPHTLGPHDKYYWAMKAYPDDIVITVDDDLRYPLWLIEQLLAEHYRNPHAVIACRSHLVRVEETDDANGTRIAPYAKWTLEQKEHLGTARHDLLATGGAGALYPPHFFDEELFDEAAIRELSLYADDLWMFINELRLDIPVVNTPRTYELSYVDHTQECALCNENLGQGGNDVFLGKLFGRFGDAHEKLLQAAQDNVIPSPRDTVPAETDGAPNDERPALPVSGVLRKIMDPLMPVGSKRREAAKNLAWKLKGK